MNPPVDLHPESERDRFEDAYKKSLIQKAPCEGFHIQRKDGSGVPVLILSSGIFESNGHTLVICGLCDYTERERREHRFLNQNCALAAYAGAASAFGKFLSSKGLLHSVCESIAGQSIYSLASVAIAENDSARRIRTEVAVGSALGYLDEMKLSWSEDDTAGQSPLGICIRTNSTQIVDDTEVPEGVSLWDARAFQAGLRSLATIPFSVEGGWRGALIVGSPSPHVFDKVSVELFQHLAVQLGHGAYILDAEKLSDAGQAQLERTQEQLTEALAAISSAMVSAVDMLGPFVIGCQNRVEEVADAIARELDAPVE